MNKKVTLHVSLDDETMNEFERSLDIPPDENIVSIHITQDHDWLKQEWLIEIETVQG